MKWIVLIISVLAMAACASAPAPIVYGPATRPPVIYGPPGAPENPPSGSFQPNAYLRTCQGMGVSNAPPLDGEGWVVDFNPIIVVNNVVLASVPVNDVCLSSGKGFRGSREHDGIDVTRRPGGPIYSAAPGIVREARSSPGYGTQVLIDHGRGVYTRYAHLADLKPGIQPGAEIGFGYDLGMMGDSGNATAVHLHYEILTGDYLNPRGSKGLQSHDPFSFPAWAGPGS